MNTGFADRIVCAITAACEENDPTARRWIVWVIFNRAQINPARYGSTPAAVCLKRMQFSEWNADSADNANLERVAAKAPDDPVILDALAAYDEVLAAVVAGEGDPTGGAVNFYADTIAAPAWTQGATMTGKQGSTMFFANVK
jgi:hypothetical protein